MSTYTYPDWQCDCGATGNGESGLTEHLVEVHDDADHDGWTEL